MSKSKKQKATLNIATAFLLEIVAVICGFILPRLVLQAYGSAYNGILASATHFFSLINLLTLGVTASTRVALYHTLAAEDIKGTSAIVKATENYMRKVSYFLAIYIVLLACIYPLLIETGFSFFDVSALILVVGLSSFAEYYFGITYSTLLLADQSSYISNVFAILATILNTVLTILLINAGYTIQVVKLGSSVVFGLKPLLQYIYVSKVYHIDKTCKPDLSALKERSAAMMHVLANIVHEHVSLVVLTILTDVKTVSVYAIYNLVVSGLQKLQKVFTIGTEPIFGNMWAKGELNSIRKNLSIYEYFISSFSTIVYSDALVMILPFISIYTKNVIDMNYIRPLYAFVIILAFVIFSFRTPYVALVQGIGHYKQTKVGAVWEAVINIIVSVTLVAIIPQYDMKMIGVAIGALIANFFRTIQYALYIDNNVIRRGKHVFILKILWTFMNMAIIVLPSYSLVQRMAINSWFQWLEVSVALFLFSLIVVGISSLIFLRDDMNATLHVIQQMVNKRLGKH